MFQFARPQGTSQRVQNYPWHCSEAWARGGGSGPFVLLGPVTWSDMRMGFHRRFGVARKGTRWVERRLATSEYNIHTSNAMLNVVGSDTESAETMDMRLHQYIARARAEN